MKSWIKSNYIAIIVSAVFVLAISYFMNVYNFSGEWYPTNFLHHFYQMRAFLDGHIGISSSASNIDFDEVWFNGSVQHVVGLGIPLLKLPFYFVYKLFTGDYIFPDRFIILGLFAFCVSFFYLSIVRFVKKYFDKLSYHKSLAIFITAFVFLFPPFLILMRNIWIVNIEIIVWYYLFASILLSILFRMIVDKHIKWLYIATVLTGFSPFIRPTLVIPCLALLFFIWISYEGWRNRKATIISLVILGVFAGLLLYSNNARFGAPLEFGHSLNLKHNEPLIMYSTKFDYDFRDVSFVDATKDLFGFMFYQGDSIYKIINKKATVPNEMYYGQTDACRWHSDIFFIYNYFVGILLALTIISFIVFRALQLRKQKEFNVSDYLSLSGIASFLGLVVFYFRLPGLSAPYSGDFAFSFMLIFLSVIFLALFALNKYAKKIRIIGLIGILLAIIAFYSYYVVSFHIYGPSSIDTVEDYDSFKKRINPVSDRTVILPSLYIKGENVKLYGVWLNGIGWDMKSGNTESITTFLVSDPKFLKINVRFLPYSKTTVSDIQAKINLEYLKLEKSEKLKDGSYELYFKGPQKERNQKGIQNLFIAFAKSAECDTADSGVILEKLSWR